MLLVLSRASLYGYMRENGEMVTPEETGPELECGTPGLSDRVELPRGDA
jgi:hypothetical protein